jgi:hypothetical protein
VICCHVFPGESLVVVETGPGTLHARTQWRSVQY